MSLRVKFNNPPQREFYYSNKRNQCFSGGFNNGKTFIGVFKIITLCLTFPMYRAVIARQTYSHLRITTMQTFLQICPSEIIEAHNEQVGLTVFKNGSMIYWLHLDKVDENALRGLEANAILVDQAEEMEEKVYDILDARVGRWSGALVPKELLDSIKDWPRDKFDRPIVPSYHMLLCNPDTQFHFIYRKFHPDSIERIEDYFFVEGEWDPTLGSVETYNSSLLKDKEWVLKHMKGQWGLSSAQIHRLPSDGILEFNKDLLEIILTKGALFRILDHGDSAPTCCLWFAAVLGIYICYREYYVPGRPISFHRQSISDLSGNEKYENNYADPQIFKKTAQKDGGFWSVHDEYTTDDIDAPALFWQKADNNEFATRNRINELLQSSARFKHPITASTPAIGMYFLKSSEEYPYGCKEAIKQIGSQRRKLLGTVDGKSIYSDDREASIADHAYDCERYFVAMHGVQPKTHKPKPPKNSFAYFNQLLSRRKQMDQGRYS